MSATFGKPGLGDMIDYAADLNEALGGLVDVLGFIQNGLTESAIECLCDAMPKVRCTQQWLETEIRDAQRAAKDGAP